MNVCRLILAFTFIFSGYVKAIDPLGTQYKLQEYLENTPFHLLTNHWFTLSASVLLSTIEFSLGIFLLFVVRRKQTARAIFIIMIAMTAFTLYTYLYNPISDCGCFGDAIKLSNTQTLLKNIVLLPCAFVVSYGHERMIRFISKNNRWILVNYTLIFILFSSAYSLYYLPLFDFRPFSIGSNINEKMSIPKGAKQPKFETSFILEKNGLQKEFTLNNYPDSTWTFIDSKTIQTEEGYIPPIHDFSIETKDGEDITQSILQNEKYTFILVSPYIEQADEASFGDIDKLYEYALEYGYPFYCLTASGEKGINIWRNITGAEYPFCQTDATTLKTIIRSNPGLLLLKKGTIINKWSCHDLPKDNDLKGKIEQTNLIKAQPQDITTKTTKLILWFFCPLILLCIADRLWAWTRWVKEKEQSNFLYNKLFKKKINMRKKIVAGNWKMNMNLQDGLALAKGLNDALTADKPNCDVVICTPFIHLASAATILDENLIGLGAENCADKEKGAYTGEISAEMVKSTGANYVILGHSERRQYYGETPEILKEKTLLALKNNLKVIFCIGETLEEREANKQNEVVKAQLEGSVFNLTAEEFANVIVAYEPIWAIGTGKTATAEQAEEIHAFIRSAIAEKYGNEVAENTSILYGGSCKASNAPELFSKTNIDGGLIGGAALKVEDFKGIIDAWKK